jgi:hypothetical protein
MGVFGGLKPFHFIEKKFLLQISKIATFSTTRTTFGKLASKKRVGSSLEI